MIFLLYKHITRGVVVERPSGEEDVAVAMSVLQQEIEKSGVYINCDFYF